MTYPIGECVTEQGPQRKSLPTEGLEPVPLEIAKNGKMVFVFPQKDVKETQITFI